MFIKNYQKTTEQWVDIISKQELPAITSTARLLDSFSNDDTSSLPKLSKVILHDQGLSSCLLKVANSVTHIGRSKITTVSRASVVLGIQSVKSICLTSKLIDGLLKNEHLAPEVYERLTRLMATSFYAGLLAQMMIPNYNEDTKEEVYLAAMLYRIGETAFWSVGGEVTKELIVSTSLSETNFENKCEEVIGTNFKALSQSLASNWSLGSLLEKSLDNPESRTVEMQIINLADKLSGFIDRPPATIEEFDAVLDKICRIKKVSLRQLKHQIENIRKSAISLLNSYGAHNLKSLIKPLPTEKDFSGVVESPLNEVISVEKAQLQALKSLSQLTKSSRDFNDFIQSALKSLSQILKFERSAFFLLTAEKDQVSARFSFNALGEIEKLVSKINISKSQNIISYAINEELSVLINDHTQVKWRNYINQNIDELIAEGSICLTPVSINNSVIGIVVGQHITEKKIISDEDYERFCFLVEHLNMCLSMISRK